ncbi:MAG TPA: SRPBCC family protein [Candidatus Obscuribacterales bacterium]
MPPLTLKRQVEIDIACSVEQVYNLWNDLENVPRWMPLVKSVKPLPGQSDLWRWQFGLGFPLIVEWVSHIDQRVPLQRIAWRSVSGLPNDGQAEFFSSDRGCRLCLTLGFELPGGLVGAMLETIGIDRWLEANLVDSLHRFQTQIEAEVLRQTAS